MTENPNPTLEILALKNTVGEITGYWAEIEDQLFFLFVTVLNGTWMVENLRPYRAVFLSHRSYDGKMRMINGSIKARYTSNETVLEQWKEIKIELDRFSNFRNNVAHLVVSTVPSKTGKTYPKLAAAFWERAFSQFESREGRSYSLVQLQNEFAEYRGQDRAGHPVRPQLTYRLQQFAISLQPPLPSEVQPPQPPS